MKVVTIGSAMRDIFIQWCDAPSIEYMAPDGPQHFLLVPEGDKIEIDHVIYSTGGGATNSAASFTRMGIESHAVFCVGDDLVGKSVIQELEAMKIDCSHAQRTKNATTGTSFVIPCPSGDRSIFVHRGANLMLGKNSLPWDLLGQADYLYITSLSGDTALIFPSLVEFAKHNNIPVATNPGGSQLHAHAESLCAWSNGLDIMIVNAQEAAQIYKEAAPGNPFSVPAYCREMLSRGVKIAVVTKDVDGVWVAHENTLYHHPSIQAPIASTIGAGDAFGSAFTASIYQGYSLEESLVRGIINASSVIGQFDAKSGLLSKNELDLRMGEIGAKNITTQPLS